MSVDEAIRVVQDDGRVVLQSEAWEHGITRYRWRVYHDVPPSERVTRHFTDRGLVQFAERIKKGWERR